MENRIVIRGAREHNLKNIDLAIPRDRLVVLTGVSGSGKSTIAFDILQREAQRQFMEALGMVSWNLSRPLVDSITGLCPSISIGQHLANRSPRSTVGTVTEIYTYLRVLFARLGVRPCPACGRAIPPAHEVGRAGGSCAGGDEPFDVETLPCPHCGALVPELTMASFSFNKPAGACPSCTGLGVIHRADAARLFDDGLAVADGGVRGWSRPEADYHARVLEAAGRHFGRPFDVHRPIRDLEEWQHDLLVHGALGERFLRHFPGAEPPPTAARGRFEGVATALLRRYAEHADDPDYLAKRAGAVVTTTCAECGGARLSVAARAVTVNGLDIVAVSRLPLAEVADWLAETARPLTGDSRALAAPVFADLESRIRHVLDVGVGYLSLDRSSPTLSAGEAQRLRLAALLGCGLTGVLYIFDEPTIGLHPRDTVRLVRLLKDLRDAGNTVLVIEHDPDVVREADAVVDIGPGAGTGGGEIVAYGTPMEIARCPASLTGRHLSAPTPPPRAGRAGSGASLRIHGASEHNLKGIEVEIPLGMLVALTGVSGSGKSTLAFDILERAARRRFGEPAEEPGRHDRIEGWEALERVVSIDPSPIGRVPRSNAATYTDVFSGIRAVFAALPEAKAAGLTGGHFSFNTPGGRCEHCEGAGVLPVHMHFLPSVDVRCPTCRGGRFKPEVLAVTRRGRTIAEVLEMTIDEATGHFADVPAVARKLALMRDVGLGYLRLGQSATTLSGGEAQRIKLSKELAARTRGRTLYLLDEPSTGLHPHDVERLLAVLDRLVERGHTVLVVEHNLEIIRAADWVIDLGPGGGDAGGEVVAAGRPAEIARGPRSHTGRCLA